MKVYGTRNSPNPEDLIKMQIELYRDEVPPVAPKNQKANNANHNNKNHKQQKKRRSKDKFEVEDVAS